MRKQAYTAFQLDITMNLKYTKRLCAMLSQPKDGGSFDMPIEDLKRPLAINDPKGKDSYPFYMNESAVLASSKKQTNEKP